MRHVGLIGTAALTLVLAMMVLSNLPALSGAHAALGAAAPFGSATMRAPNHPAPSHVQYASGTIRPERVSVSPNPNSVRPSDVCTNTPNWVSGSTNFFTDVDVCFSNLYGGSLNFPTVPLQGNLSQWALGFWVNISSNVKIFAANLCLWATSWPTTGLGPQPVAGYDPSQWNSADCKSMIVGTSSGQNPDTASYFVDCYKYFYPGTNLSFMIKVTSGVGQIYSYKTLNETESYSSGYTTYPTWTVYVQAPFASYNFTNDFRVTTTPSVLTHPSYPPNPTQNVQVTLSSFNESGGPPEPIPAAYAVYSVITPGKGGYSTAYSVSFGPSNDTVMTLNSPIQHQPAGTLVSFNITAFRYWDGASHIDQVTSQPFNFTFSSGGILPQPNAPLEVNAILSSTPSVFVPGVTSLPTGTSVNVSVHEPLENVTFTSAEVDFKFTDHGATTIGSIPMTAANANTSFAALPGLPSNTSLAFSVVVKDIAGDADSSGVYTFAETGSPVPALPSGQGFFFVEVYDVATNHLVAGANFTVENLTWFQDAQISPLGFGDLLTNAGTQPDYLSFGTYYLTVHAFGATVQRPITLSGTNPEFTITFYVASSPVTLKTSAPSPVLYTMGGLVGILAAGVTIIPIRRWFQERRAKAEAEQRRVTL
ncbi:MAG: hypothetical protein L3J95_02090 [Thermoplasmata archaeon]|nr:hypothetical protein [Thermoplasmata archaeon]MCI4359202.1 hypothetical protein [Thermoplasmata archaeon]